MNTSPVPTPKLHFFSYKSAFLFFGFILVFNLIFNPILGFFGVNKQLALYLINSLGISGGLTGAIVLIEGKFKTKKQMAMLFSALLAVCLVICYLIVFL
ncbi:hypothetical protein [Neobacillus niacini]|uniref:hypothetical protein n=1 Tax=Neobacillus niacini TaxID=86668 RepID=UPI0021CB33C2|nr:hypothetical protein [Neobacillus niacini]MCM3763660.1 hypothetical protein [Neobacillus niacini]